MCVCIYSENNAQTFDVGMADLRKWWERDDQGRKGPNLFEDQQVGINKGSVVGRIMSLPSHKVASCENVTVHGKGDYRYFRKTKRISIF